MTDRYQCTFTGCTSMLAQPGKWGNLCPTHLATVDAVAKTFFNIMDRRDAEHDEVSG